MPIIGVTSGKDSLDMPLIGALHAGAPKTADGKLGRNLKTFRASFEDLLDAETRAILERGFIEVYGSLTPARIDNIVTFGSTPDDVFPNWLVQYGDAGINRRCDGQNIHFEWVRNQGWDNNKRTCERMTKGSCACQMSAYFYFTLPELTAYTNIAGKFRYHTVSRNNITGIYGALNLAYLKRRSLVGQSFSMYRSEETIMKIMKGKDGKTTRTRGKETLVRIAENAHANDRFMLEGFAQSPVLLASGDYEIELPQLPESVEVDRDDIPLSEQPERADALINYLNEQGLSVTDVRNILGGDPTVSRLTPRQAMVKINDYLEWASSREQLPADTED